MDSASSLPTELPVTGTASRPSFLPFFVLGRNSLTPRLAVGGDGVEIRVVGTTRLAWPAIERVDVRKGFGSRYIVLTARGWDYIAHFRDDEALRRLVCILRDNGVTLSPAAAALTASR